VTLVALGGAPPPAHASPSPARGEGSNAAVRISPEDPASVQVGIDAAYKAGAKKVVIPAGTYRLPQPTGRYYLRLAEVSDFEIDATGVTFLRTDPTKGGIEFYRCRNVTLRGATLINETPPFTQGAIEAIDPAGQYYDVRIDAGYPAKFDDPKYFPPDPTGYVFNPKTRQWKAGTYDLSATRVERLGPDRFRLFWRGKPRHAAAVGDLMAFRGKGGTDIYVGNCAGMNLTEVAIRSGGGFCIHEADGDGGSRFSYKVTYGPRPAGAAADPIIACNADAFHSSNVRRGPLVENCLFEGMPDDGVPIHGTYAMVAEAEAERLVVCFLHGNFFREGDPLRLFSREGAWLGETAVKAIAPAKGYQPKAATTLTRFKESSNHYRLTLDRALPAAFECLISNPAACGSGYVVRNNVIRNHRARGMLLKADNGLVEGNTVDGSTIAGIVVAPELWWMEACYSRNVIIRNNTIRHVGYATTGPWNMQAGAITVTGASEKTTSPGGHRHMVIEGNTVENCDGPNLVISAATDVMVRNNRFVSPMREPSRRGADRGIDPGALIWLSDCEDMRLEGNTISQPGPAMEKSVVTTPTAKNVVGVDTGVKR
jgi:hypothetical protein